jgi:hypothetical protein
MSSEHAHLMARALHPVAFIHFEGTDVILTEHLVDFRPDHHNEALEYLFSIYNGMSPINSRDCPTSHNGPRSLSTGDVVVLLYYRRVAVYEVDAIGWRRLDHHEASHPNR